MLHWSSSASTPEDHWKVFLCIFLALAILAALSRHQWMHRLKRSQSSREISETEEQYSSTPELDELKH
jgi:membrane protein implicated in regulation of membrane protease activity